MKLYELDEFVTYTPTLSARLLNWRHWPIVGPNRNKPRREASAEQKREAAIARARSSASAVQLLGSNLITVQFTSEDPRLAARAADRLADLYIESTLQAKLDVTRKASAWIGKQLEGVSEKLSNSEKALQDFREQESLLNVGGARGLLEEELRANSARLRDSQLETTRLKAAIDQIRLASNSPDSLENISSLLLDSVVKSAATNFLDAQNELKKLEKRYGSRHPNMSNAQARLDAAKSAFLDQLRIKSRGLESEYRIAISNKRQVESKVANLRARIQKLDSKQFELSALEREVKSDRQFYNLFLNRFKETESNASYDEVNARVVDFAQVPHRPYSPEVRKTALLWTIAGLFFAVLLITLRESLRTSIESVEDLEHISHLPTLGILPVVKGGKRDAIAKLVVKDPKAPFADGIRGVKTALMLSDPDKARRCIAVTSSVPQEGKTTVSAALATAFAQHQKVLVIDTDLRRSRLSKAMGQKRNRIGLSELLTDSAERSECIAHDELTGVDVLAAGAPPTNPSQILASAQFRELIAELSGDYDRIFLDTPPINATSDALYLMNLVDAVVFVARSEMTAKGALKHALKQLNNLGAPVVGLVLNGAGARRSYGRNYGYYNYGRY